MEVCRAPGQQRRERLGRLPGRGHHRHTGGHTPGEALQLPLPSFPQSRQETELEGHMKGHMKSHGAGIQIQICLVLTPILFLLHGRLCEGMLSALGLQER